MLKLIETVFFSLCMWNARCALCYTFKIVYPSQIFFALFVVLLSIHYCTCTLLRRNGYIYIRVFAERYFVYIDYC